MASRTQWRLKTKYALVAFGVAAAFVGVIVLVIWGYRVSWTGFTVQSSQPTKTLWDWMQLLIVPLVLAVGGVLYNRARDWTDRQIASDKQREDILQAYLDTISTLLLEKDLGQRKKDSDKSGERPVVQDVAQVRTLTVLRRLDADRKSSVLQFLYQSGLIGSLYVSLHLDNADLHEINLPGAYLTGAELSRTDLSKANLSKAYLAGADLLEANLYKANLHKATLSRARLGLIAYKIEPSEADKRGANLRKADLREADLRKADLEYANLSKADLRKADLRDANLHKANLRGAKLRGALLDGVDLREAIIIARQLDTAKSRKNVIR